MIWSSSDLSDQRVSFQGENSSNDHLQLTQTSKNAQIKSFHFSTVHLRIPAFWGRPSGLQHLAAVQQELHSNPSELNRWHILPVVSLILQTRRTRTRIGATDALLFFSQAAFLHAHTVNSSPSKQWNWMYQNTTQKWSSPYISRGGIRFPRHHYLPGMKSFHTKRFVPGLYKVIISGLVFEKIIHGSWRRSRENRAVSLRPK